MFKLKFKQNTRIMAVLLTAVILMISIFYCCSSVTARAATSGYSDVLDDLHIDSSFDENNYPEVSDDYSLQVIQIAESTDGELLIYVYQPSGQAKNLKATSIRFSTDQINWLDYPLTYVNSNGVFYKYVVNDFTVKAYSDRYYDIAAIHRKWDGSFDEGLPDYNENTINYKAFEVAQLWEAYTENSEVIYRMTTSEVVEITSYYAGNIRYYNGVHGLAFITKDYVDSHYIAFSTDWDIDDLLEVEVKFIEQAYKYSSDGLNGTPDKDIPFGSPVSTVKRVYNTEEGSNSPYGWKYFGRGEARSWERIQSVSDFIKNTDLTSEEKVDVQDKEWVVRYYETEYSKSSDPIGAYTIDYTKITEITILSLRFQKDGQVYNLGVVSDIFTGDGIPGNNDIDAYDGDILELLKKIFAVVCIILIVLFLAVVCPPILFLLKLLFKGIVLIVSLPFRLIAWVFKK